MNERIQERLDTAVWRIRRPAMKTKGFHLIRLSTEINLLAGAKLQVGKHVTTQKRVTISVIGGTMTIGSNVSFNRNNILVCHDEITIGNYCAFGPNVVVYDHDHKFSWKGIANDDFNTAPIVIEDHCWIGANVTILRGTHIGEGSVIGAGTMVKGSIPPHSLVTGARGLIIKQIKEEE